ncbi:MAG: sigma-54-dependent Fis family transcriptional regulator [Bacteroidetes bacterium HGW-Bacteroidetes-21]|jgi:transcriptional regulator with PAS, ATPase and Fis domain|nr:MAG: sigma-54-dependent Fis family transcriptional regulator [Bacteroidetes bacterium HGW-Bacteroidetes-21]
MTDIQQIKQRYGIIGHSPLLIRAIDVAVQVAATDLSVLITGESGTGKEVFPQIIHQFSPRKHGTYIAVNCGAIPEGTIDSELFGHEKGSFTGAYDKRKGYFEVADNGTIFLDEVAELPLSTQVRLLRVLESGEFMKVGSSVGQKTNVRVVAATNVNVQQAIEKGEFREDLYYRLNSVPIKIPALRERKEDVEMLFKKFAADFSEKYRMPPIRLEPEARDLLIGFDWPGNIRQLKNITEQISIIEQDRNITGQTIKLYLPESFSRLPVLMKNDPIDNKSFNNEREILYQVLWDMKRDITELKKLVHENVHEPVTYNDNNPINDFQDTQFVQPSVIHKVSEPQNKYPVINPAEIQDTEVFEEESLSLADNEKELIKKALDKHNGKRKLAASELGISDRTLFRKIKEYDL